VKLLAIGRPLPAVETRTAIARHAAEELRMLWEFYGNGFVREMHSPGGLGAVLILEAASLEAAQERLAELPLVGNEIIEFELIELQPFTAFERLFSDP
jgi:hypothetical protein